LADLHKVSIQNIVAGRKFFENSGKAKRQGANVVVPTKSYQALQKKAALKTKPEKTLSIEEGRAHSKKPIKKWATAK